VRTVQGYTWQAHTLTQVLKHPRNAGLLTYQGVVVGRYAGMEPIITEEEYQALAAKFLSRKRGRPVTDPYMLSGGILICGKCGNSLIGKAGNGHLANGTKRRNYVCPVRRDDTEECGKVAVAVHRVEPAVRDLVVRILADPKHARQIARASAKLAAAQAKLDAAQSDATELSRRLGEGRMPLDRYDAAMGPLEIRITRLKRDVDALKGAGADQAAHTASVEEITREWDEADVATRRAMIRRVAPRGILVKTVTRGEFSRMSDTAERLVVL
jgi:hypothetical protein